MAEIDWDKLVREFSPKPSDVRLVPDVQPSEEEFLYGIPGGVVPQGVIHADEVEPTAAQIARIRGDLIERCIERAYLWAVMAGTPEARKAALDIAREMRELGKEE